MQDLEHGWLCDECTKRLWAMRKCIACGAQYEGDGDEGEVGPHGGKQVHATNDEALALIIQARMAGTL